MSITNNIKTSFYPGVYPESIATQHDLNLCLFKKIGMGRYVLAVTDFKQELDIKTQIANVRRQIRKYNSALWLFNEVGAYIVFVCEDLPDLSESQLEVDRTGFHAVIIQGVHLISKSNKHLFNHVKWLNTSFGGAQSIASRLVDNAI